MKIHDIICESRGSLAKKLGVTLGDLRDMTDQELKQILRRVGKHDFTPNSKFDKLELHKGIMVELEHTTSRLIATLIAKDHLSEDPKYYTKLSTLKL
jgi:hypothetical protein